jgi:hypothetical protein
LNQSDDLNELAKALAAAQAEMPVVVMDSKNPFYNSKYSSLSAILSVVLPILGKHGLAFSQLPYFEGEQVGLHNLLMHESGQWLNQDIQVPFKSEKNFIQSVGIFITYLRRYSVAAILGIASEEDTDGQSKTEKKTAKEPTPEKELTEVGKAQKLVVDLCKEFPKEQKVAVMAILKSYDESSNPNRIEDLGQLKKLHSELVALKEKKE